jgi:phage antirepressor YoqD-like protein
MQNLQLTKSSSESDLKRYFTAVLELSKSDNKFPINLDEVWPLVYSEKSKAVRALRKNFFENEDYTRLAQNGESVKRQENGRLDGSFQTSYYLSLSCMEYFIARKVRPVFEVYRQVFHKVATTPALPSTYKEALTALLAQVEANEKLQLENDVMRPKARTYDVVIQTPDDVHLRTTTAVANEIGMSGQKLNKMLCAIGVIYKAKNGEYLFCTDYLKWDLGKQISTLVNEEKGYIRNYIKWNARGRAYIHALHECEWNKRRAWHLLKEGKEVTL